jgi:FtsZ-binding cell division protein ZapB
MIFDRAAARCAAVVLTAALGCALNSVAVAATAPDQGDVSAQRTAQANPFADVPPNHWAYDAVRQLAADGYIQGYPDGQFKGQRPMTRYEAAVLTDRAVRSIEAKLAQMQQVEQRDIAAVRALINAFRPELDQLKSQVAQLQQRSNDQQRQLDALKREADATQLRVNQGKVGFQLIYKPGTAFTNVSVVNGGPTPAFGAASGQVIPGGQHGTTANDNGTAFSYGPGALNSTPLGPIQHGINYMLARFFLGGQIDPRWSYGVRVSAKLTLENPFGVTTAKNAFCTSVPATGVNCSFQDLNNGQGTIPLNLDYAYLGYSSPGGITAQLGRYSVGAYGKYAHGPDALLFGGQQLSGFNLGFRDPAGRLFAQLYYGIPSISSFTLSGQQLGGAQPVCSANVVGVNLGAVQQQFAQVNPNCNTTQSEIGAWAGYYFPYPRIFIGGEYDSFFGKQFTFYNSSAVNCTYAGVLRQAASPALCTANGGTYVPGTPTGNYLTAQGNPTAVGVYTSLYAGPYNRPTWNLQFEWARHLGSDPFTGRNWNGPDAFSATLTYASKGNVYGTPSRDNPFYSSAGRAHSNVAQLLYQQFGLNSLGGIDTGYNGTTPFQNNTGFANLNGMQLFGVIYGYWFTDNVRATVGALHLQNIPGVTIPVGTNGTANTCSGCFVNFVNQNQINGEVYLYFF